MVNNRRIKNHHYLILTLARVIMMMIAMIRVMRHYQSIPLNLKKVKMIRAMMKNTNYMIVKMMIM